MAYITLKKNTGQRILKGHPWVYQGEIGKIHGNFLDGDIISVKDFKNRFLGEGFINSKSQITVRLLSQKKESIDKEFFKQRIQSACNYRSQFTGDTNAKRIIFSEGDFLPGLIVDDYNGNLVIQTLTLGMDQRKNIITEVLQEVLKPKVIYERNDSPVRKREGLLEKKGLLYGTLEGPIICDMNGVVFLVDIDKGHKTGIYLDQRENYLAVKDIVQGKKVLDCFCYTGGFGIHAARFGAEKVEGIDISEEAITIAKKNAELNNIANICSWHAGNVFDILKDKTKQREKYDIIVLDPPSFTKNKETISAALRGYKEINLRALQLLPQDGYLVTCCCSHHVSRNLFMEVIIDAAKDAEKHLRLVEFRTQSKDHPIIPAIPETEYLKCIILQVV